jgi:hypothetical protein
VRGGARAGRHRRWMPRPGGRRHAGWRRDAGRMQGTANTEGGLPALTRVLRRRRGGCRLPAAVRLPPATAIDWLGVVWGAEMRQHEQNIRGRRGGSLSRGSPFGRLKGHVWSSGPCPLPVAALMFSGTRRPDHARCRFDVWLHTTA